MAGGYVIISPVFVAARASGAGKKQIARCRLGRSSTVTAARISRRIGATLMRDVVFIIVPVLT